MAILLNLNLKSKTFFNISKSMLHFKSEQLILNLCSFSTIYPW